MSDDDCVQMARRSSYKSAASLCCCNMPTRTLLRKTEPIVIELKSRSKKSKSTRRRAIRVGEVAGALALILAVAFVVYIIIPPQAPISEQQSPKAVIVDEVSVQFANPQFIETAQSIMNAEDLGVDNYGAQSVTVNFYVTLPTYGYKLILLRVHGGVDQQTEGHPVGLYTSEPYSELSYPQEQLSGLVATGRSYNRSEQAVFAVTPKFIAERSADDYHGALVIIMGCYGLFSVDLPKAFVDRGASTVIGWNGLVGSEHTDKATLYLLRELLTQKRSISESIRATIDEVGPDPDHNSTMRYYPKEAGDLKFSGIIEGSASESGATISSPVALIDTKIGSSATRSEFVTTRRDGL